MTTTSTGRRGLLGTAGALLVAPMLVRPAAAQSVPFSAGLEKPKLKAPPNATDCHFRVPPRSTIRNRPQTTSPKSAASTVMVDA